MAEFIGHASVAPWNRIGKHLLYSLYCAIELYLYNCVPHFNFLCQLVSEITGFQKLSPDPRLGARSEVAVKSSLLLNI